MRPVDRSMNDDLTEGMTDGKLKKVNPNRGGLDEGASDVHRSNLGQDYDFSSIGHSAGAERPDIAGLLP